MRGVALLLQHPRFPVSARGADRAAAAAIAYDPRCDLSILAENIVKMRWGEARRADVAK